MTGINHSLVPPIQCSGIFSHTYAPSTGGPYNVQMPFLNGTGVIFWGTEDLNAKDAAFNYFKKETCHVDDVDFEISIPWVAGT